MPYSSKIDVSNGIRKWQRTCSSGGSRNSWAPGLALAQVKCLAGPHQAQEVCRIRHAPNLRRQAWRGQKIGATFRRNNCVKMAHRGQTVLKSPALGFKGQSFSKVPCTHLDNAYPPKVQLCAERRRTRRDARKGINSTIGGWRLYDFWKKLFFQK